MQERYFDGRRIIELHPQIERQRLERALEGEEVLPFAIGSQTDRLALLGQFGERERFCDEYVRQLVQARRLVSAANVAHKRIQHGRRKRGAHDAHILADGVFDLYSPFRLVADAQKLVILGRDEGIGDDLRIVLHAQGAFCALLRLLRRRKPALRRLCVFQEGTFDVVVAVFTDDLLGDIGIPLDVLAVGGRGDGEQIALRRDIEVQPRQNVLDRRLRHLDAEERVDL